MREELEAGWKPKLAARFAGCEEVATVENPHGTGYYTVYALSTGARLVGIRAPDGACWVANPECVLPSARLVVRLAELGEHKPQPRKRLRE